MTICGIDDADDDDDDDDDDDRWSMINDQWSLMIIGINPALITPWVFDHRSE